jgi:hypothetical protein
MRATLQGEVPTGVGQLSNNDRRHRQTSTDYLPSLVAKMRKHKRIAAFLDKEAVEGVVSDRAVCPLRVRQRRYQAGIHGQSDKVVTCNLRLSGPCRLVSNSNRRLGKRVGDEVTPLHESGRSGRRVEGPPANALLTIGEDAWSHSRT